MVKPKVPKIFKVVKKTVDDKDQLIVRYRHLPKEHVKQLKKELDVYCKHYLEKIVPQE